MDAVQMKWNGNGTVVFFAPTVSARLVCVGTTALMTIMMLVGMYTMHIIFHTCNTNSHFPSILMDLSVDGIGECSPPIP